MKNIISVIMTYLLAAAILFVAVMMLPITVPCVLAYLFLECEPIKKQ